MNHIAEVTREFAYGGRVRWRCVDCDKVAYGNGERARSAAARISERVSMRAYQGKCGWWHVTRTKKGRQTTANTHRVCGPEEDHWTLVLQDPRTEGRRVW